MLRLIGAILVVVGAGSFGFRRAAQFYKSASQLRQLTGAVEMLQCEINYTRLPLPELYTEVADRQTGAVAQFFRAMSAQLASGQPRTLAARHAMQQASGLLLPSDARMALLELCETLGRYDVDGENRMLRLSAQRIQSAQERCESEKRQMARSCAALAVCAGIALAILML